MAQACAPVYCTGMSASWDWLLGPKYTLILLFLRTFLVLRNGSLFCSQRIIPIRPLNSWHSEEKKKSATTLILEVFLPFLFQSELSETTF